MSRPRLFLNIVSDRDCLIALEYGCVDDGQPPENWVGVGEDFGYLFDEPGGRALGFLVSDYTSFDAEAPDVAAIWSGARFDAPALGLTDVPAGEIVLAARALFGVGSTVNRWYFDEGVGRQGEEALHYWLCCLQAGDAMAHFALGYTLYELGRFPEAYRHLRHYTEISPSAPWNWCWYGMAAEAMGQEGEARAAYERAIALEQGRDEDEATDAFQRLKAMGDVRPDSASLD